MPKIYGDSRVEASLEVGVNLNVNGTFSGNTVTIDGPGGSAFTKIIDLKRNGSSVFYIDQYAAKFGDTVYLNTIYGHGTSGITFGNQSGGGRLIYLQPFTANLAIGYLTTTNNAALDILSQSASSTYIAFRIRNYDNTRNIISIKGDETIDFSIGLNNSIQFKLDSLNGLYPEILTSVSSSQAILGNYYESSVFTSSSRMRLYYGVNNDIQLRPHGTSYMLGTNLCIGTSSTTSYSLSVVGTVSTTGLRMATGASAGYVLTSDASGNSYWDQRLPYKVYVALLTQTSSNAPIAVELQNTFNFSPTFSYGSSGSYTLQMTGAFPSTKTVIFTGSPDQAPIGGNFANFIVTRYDDNSMSLLTFDVDGSGLTDGLLNNTSIEIRVYP